MNPRKREAAILMYRTNISEVAAKKIIVFICATGHETKKAVLANTRSIQCSKCDKPAFDKNSLPS